MRRSKGILRTVLLMSLIVLVFSVSLSQARPTDPETPPTMSDGYNPSIGDDDDDYDNISYAQVVRLMWAILLRGLS